MTITPAVQAFSEPGFEITGNDTIAGYGALLKISGPSYTDLEIFIEKPDKSQVIIPATTNEAGEVSLDLYPYHTRRAGIYKISSKGLQNENFSIYNSFRVYPDEVSENRSSISSDRFSLPANGFHTATVEVRLQDDYGNPINDHQIQITSSRSEDQIQAIKEAVSDAQGLTRFKISSNEKGISYFIIQDLTANKTLATRLKIAFLDVFESQKAIGGDNEIRLLAQSNNPQITSTTTMLNFADIPKQVASDTPLTFKLQALNENRQVTNNYLSTVHFSSSDPNATLPQDYQFQENDKGEHVFSIGLKFVTPGTQTLTVTDLENFSIKGEITVTVGSSANLNTPSASTSSIKLANPRSGSTKESLIELSGTAPASSELTVFDFESDIGKTSTNNSGNFSFKTSPLPEGEHQLYLAIMENKQAITISNKIDLIVDRTPPVIDAIEVKPATEVTPKTALEIKIFSENAISQASAFFNEESYNFTPLANQSGTYTLKVTAPQITGTYSLDIILTDQLGNRGSYPASSTINVSGSNVIQPDRPAANNQNDTSLPSKVTGIEADPDVNRITLSWEPSIDDTFIKQYRIYYGTSPTELSSIALTFDSSTTWYIPNLKPATNYYLKITAIDSENNESAEKSEIISATTLSGVSNSNTNEVGNTEANFSDSESTNIIYNEPMSQPPSGATATGVIVSTLLFMQIYFFSRFLFWQHQKNS